MNKIKDSKGTPSKETGAKSSNGDALNDYIYSPRVENPNPKATTDKRPSSGNFKGV